MNISKCEFCGRSNYLSEELSCKGCGAPIPVPAAASWAVYRASAFREEDIAFFGSPGANIPINVPQRSRISDFLNGAAMVGASMIGRPRL